VLDEAVTGTVILAFTILSISKKENTRELENTLKGTMG